MNRLEAFFKSAASLLLMLKTLMVSFLSFARCSSAHGCHVPVTGSLGSEEMSCVPGDPLMLPLSAVAVTESLGSEAMLYVPEDAPGGSGSGGGGGGGAAAIATICCWRIRIWIRTCMSVATIRCLTIYFSAEPVYISMRVAIAIPFLCISHAIAFFTLAFSFMLSA